MKVQLSTIIAVSICLLFLIPMVIYVRTRSTYIPADERMLESEEFRNLREEGKNLAETGEKYYEDGDLNKALEYYNKAIETYTQALKIRPENAEIHNDLGAVYYNLGKAVSEPIWTDDLRKRSLSEALDVLQEALKEVKSGVIVLTFSDKTIAEKVMKFALSQGYYAHINPEEGGEFDLYVIKGRTKDAFLKAESEFLRAKTIKERYAPAYRNLGALYISMGRKEEGIQNLELALRIEPYDKELRAYLQQIKRFR
jgi:tetratricopeptide (TPR) repeat protein